MPSKASVGWGRCRQPAIMRVTQTWEHMTSVQRQCRMQPIRSQCRSRLRKCLSVIGTRLHEASTPHVQLCDATAHTRHRKHDSQYNNARMLLAMKRALRCVLTVHVSNNFGPSSIMASTCEPRLHLPRARFAWRCQRTLGCPGAMAPEGGVAPGCSVAMERRA